MIYDTHVEFRYERHFSGICPFICDAVVKYITLEFFSVKVCLIRMFLFPFCRKLFPNENPPGALHTAMFLPTLEAQSSNDQLKKWAKAAKNYVILGTYAQTEMGHGL